MSTPSTTLTLYPLPLVYTLFFLYIEPLSTIVGAYFAHFDQDKYIIDTYPPATNIFRGTSTAEGIVLSQLANLYMAFALAEAGVLRVTTDRRVWSAFLLVLLIADLGHLYSVKPAGLQLYYSFWQWNAMYWGNLAFVYLGATMRICFLTGLGLPKSSPSAHSKLT